jgi:hypothetical protein
MFVLSGYDAFLGFLLIAAAVPVLAGGAGAHL